MVNHFARFGLEPRPWVDEHLLKERFLELSAHAHPDKMPAAEKGDAEREFKEINEAFNVLRDTRRRLLHLLEMSGASRQEHMQNVPPDALEFFSEIARMTREADAVLKEKAAATSPMLKVQLTEKGLDQIDKLQELQARLRERIRKIEERLQGMTAAWAKNPTDSAMRTLSESAAALGFLERWRAQTQERIGALTFGSAHC